ncbi:MAG: beta-propeller fold lactonase family protein [Mucilaginibacter sp.]|nr:beta-propeller fold lactonase family protein [Mucilaginibacter sp.]
MNFVLIPGQFKYALSHWFFACGLLFIFFLPAKLIAQNTLTVADGDAVILPSFSSVGCPYKWLNNNTAIGLKSNGVGDIPSFTAINKGATPITATITATPTSDGYAYIANSSLDNVSVVNTTTGDVVTDITVGNKPWAVAVSPDGSRVYVLNKNDARFAGIGTVSVIDAAQNEVINTFSVGKNAISIVVSPDGKKVYVANETSNTVSVIDLVNSVVNDISINSALAVAISNDGKKLYVTADGLLSGTLYVINTDNNSILKKIDIGLEATGLVASPDGSTIYLTNDYLNTVSAINTTSYAVTDIPVGQAPYNITVSPDGSRVYVSNLTSQSVSIINTATNSVIQSLDMPSVPQGLSVSPSGTEVYVTGYNPNTLSVINTATNQISTKPWQALANSNGNFVSAGIGCNNVPIVYKITVNPPPVIVDPVTTTVLSTQYGTDCPPQTVDVSGNYLKEGVEVTAPDGFEVSLDGVTFGNTVTVGSAGDVPATPVYFRLKSKLSAESYTGSVTLSSAGAAPVNAPITGVVTPAPLTITADNKHKFLGDDNPIFTVKYAGFVNQEDATQLTSLPLVTTTADKTSPIGFYPIIISGAVAANYDITTVPGVLEVISGTVDPPNAFTPNGDGVNDNWEIKHLDLYTNCTVEVLNRYGQKVYYSNGYPAPWNGKLNGTNLPVGTYYYIIKLGSTAKPVTGYLAILR